MKKLFHWDQWNLGHIAKHQVTRAEAEYVVSRSVPPFPRALDADKSLVRGTTAAGRVIQVIYVLHEAEDFDYETMTLEDIVTAADTTRPLVYVIHAPT